MVSETQKIGSERGNSSVSTSSSIDTGNGFNDISEHHGDQTWKQSMLKILKHAGSIALLVLMAYLIFNHAEEFNLGLKAWFKEHDCEWALPFVLTVVFGIYLGFSPYGGMPSMMSGVIFKDNILTAVTVSYLCVNIGSLVNLAWIRQLVIKHETNKCLKTILSLLLIDKIRKRQFLRRLFQTWNPIHIIVILRLPFITSGSINYLSSFQPEYISVKQCIIANAIGLLPGSVLFALFGVQLKSGQDFLMTLLKGGFEDAEGNPMTRAAAMKEKQWEIMAFGSIVLLVFIIYLKLFLYIRRIIKQSKAEEKSQRSEKVCELEME